MAKEIEGKKASIEYHKESVYGVHHNYYNDPKVAEHMSALTGQKTLHPNHIAHLEALGHKVREVPVGGKMLQTGHSNTRMSSDGYMKSGNSTAADENIA
jgi:hypothetical protein